MWYTRPDGSTDDSLTDIGALALIGGYDCGAHIRACQLPSGRMRRHPTTPRSDFSRDHIVSLCFYSLWSTDHGPLRKFLSYCLKSRFRFCEGNIGQSMLNPIVLSAILTVLGHHWLARALDVFNFPVLLLEAQFTKLGYRACLVSEIALIKVLCGGGRWWHWIFDILHKRQPTNLWYAILARKANIKDAQEYRLGYTGLMTNHWHWNSGEGGATGVDLAYLPHLARRLHEIYFRVYPCRNCGDVTE